MPEEGDNKLSFKNFKHTHYNIYSIYADFETIQKPCPKLCHTCYALYKAEKTFSSQNLI